MALKGQWLFNGSNGTGSGQNQDDTSSFNNDIFPNSGANISGGRIHFDGHDDYAVIPNGNSSAYDINQGTICTKFRLDTLSGSKQQTLFSRDAHGTSEGGHLTSYIKADGTLEVRHQAIGKSYFVNTGSTKIVPGQEYTMEYSFGPSSPMVLILRDASGNVISSSSNNQHVVDGANISLAGNNEPWTLGASQAISGQGTTTPLRDFMDGSIDKFEIDGSIATGDDTVQGTHGADFIDPGYTDADGTQVDGADGDNDTILAGSGDDTVFAGDGTDLVYGETYDDLIYGGTGDDTLYGGNENDTLFGGDGNDDMFGDDDADILYGGTGDDSMSGGSGDDRLFGGTGDDTLRGDTGDDDLYGQTGDDLVYGGDGNDSIRGGTGEDVLYGGDDRDTIYGETGDDNLYGGSGDDRLFGGIGNDTLNGETGDDSLYGESGDDVVYGGDGNDSIRGGTGDDALYGGDDRDTIYGESGDDNLFGGSGDDQLYGGDDNDTLTGGTGDDTLYGDSGEDYIFAGPGDCVDGGSGGPVDFDILDLSGSVPAGGSFTIIYSGADSNGNGQDGVVNYFDASGAPAGTLKFHEIEQIIPCFTAGTQIATPNGLRNVEDLAPGDLVTTRDNGAQPLVWAGKREVTVAEMTADPSLRPVKIAAGALGDGQPSVDLIVSPQHRVLITSDKAELLFGEPEVLVPAKHLLKLDGVTRAPICDTIYVHVMCNEHEILLSDRLWTESFQPGDLSLQGLDTAARNELFALFPALQSSQGTAGYLSARRSLKAFEVDILLSA